MPIEPGTRVGRYEVDKLVGSGGMGEVYRAHDPELHRAVALKILNPELRFDEELQERLAYEARAASALNHPNILTVYEIGDWQGQRYIVTEFVDGISFRKKLLEENLSVQEILRIMVQVTEAVAAAEAAGIVHRDIKPDNVMIREDGYVKVLDFGLAKRVGSAGHAIDTDPNIVRGTIHYMSPEHLRGTPVDSRTDVWSLGVLLYEAMTGRLPFDGEATTEIIANILRSDFSPLGRSGRTRLPAQLEQIVAGALQKNRDVRFPSVRELLSRLRDLNRQLDRQPDMGGLNPTRVAAAKDLVTEGVSIVDAPSLPELVEGKPSNLPVHLTPFLGRETETLAVQELLTRDDVRLVTLTGPGGTGKTRLALQAALETMPMFRHGAFLVLLSSIRDPEMVPSAIAQALGVHEALGTPVVGAIKRFLENRSVLILLDNMEQVVSAAPVLVALLEKAPLSKILVTSRALLRVTGEHEYAVPPLRLPELGNLPPIEDLLRNPSVALFVQRARTIKPEFEMNHENARAIAEICHRLDGLPLAIELAAARIKLLPPKSMLARMESRLNVLTGGSRDLPSRQQTMRGAISWGHNLLDDAERRLFARMSVFSGGATLDAVESVCESGGGLGVDVLDGVSSLVDKSFVRREEYGEGEPRFTILSTIREYGLENLAVSGETELMRRRHAEFFLQFAESAEPELGRGEQGQWLERLETEHDNLCDAIAWAVELSESSMALRLAASLWRFWYLRGHYAEGLKWLEAALRVCPEGVETQEKGRAQVGAGVLAFLQCDYDRAAHLLEETVTIARATSDRQTLALALQSLGSIARERGDYDQSLDLHHVALTFRREAGDPSGVARSLNYIGFAAWLSGDYERALSVCTEALQMFRDLGDKEGMAWSVINLAATAQWQGDPEKAMGLGKEGLALSREVGFKEGIAWSLNVLGTVSRQRNDIGRGEGFLRKSLEFHWDLGDRWRTASVLEALAGMAVEREEYAPAGRLLGAAEALRESIGTPVPPAELFDHDNDLETVHRELGDDAFATAIAEGRSAVLRELVDEILGR